MPDTTSLFSKKIRTIALFIGIFSFSVFNSFAYEPTEDSAKKTITIAATEKKEGFDAGKLITEHVSDSYGWHMWGEGHHAVSIPLPIILYTDKGLDVFMSSAFHHGMEDVNGKYTYRLEENHIKIVDKSIPYRYGCFSCNVP